jgi:MAE_28990/MAE_18760-like HEPN
MKIRSIAELQKLLDDETKEAKREMTTLHQWLRSPRQHERPLLFKSAVLLLYARWERCAKQAAEAYLTYIIRQGLSYAQLAPSFLFYAVGQSLETDRRPNMRNFDAFSKTLAFFAEPVEDKFAISNIPEYLASREHQNLASNEFRLLVQKLGLPYNDSYATREKAIESLMGYRNPFAHGGVSGELPNDVEGTFQEQCETVRHCLELLKDQILDAASQKSYLRQGLTSTVPAEVNE